MTYSLETQLRFGCEGERQLDAFFADEWVIQRVERWLQRLGIDRFFTNKKNGQRYAVEYKTDYQAHETQNAFIETVSVDRTGKAGWALASVAQWLVYYVPGSGDIYMADMIEMRRFLPEWQERYPEEIVVPNKDYQTRGLLVPLPKFIECCCGVYQISEILNK